MSQYATYDPRSGRAGGNYGTGRRSSGGFGSQTGGLGSTGGGFGGGGFGSQGSMGSGANVGQGFGNIDQSHAGTFGTGGLLGMGFTGVDTFQTGTNRAGQPQFGVGRISDTGHWQEGTPAVEFGYDDQGNWNPEAIPATPGRWVSDGRTYNSGSAGRAGGSPTGRIGLGGGTLPSSGGGAFPSYGNNAGCYPQNNAGTSNAPNYMGGGYGDTLYGAGGPDPMYGYGYGGGYPGGGYGGGYPGGGYGGGYPGGGGGGGGGGGPESNQPFVFRNEGGTISVPADRLKDPMRGNTLDAAGNPIRPRSGNTHEAWQKKQDRLDQHQAYKEARQGGASVGDATQSAYGGGPSQPPQGNAISRGVLQPGQVSNAMPPGQGTDAGQGIYGGRQGNMSFGPKNPPPPGMGGGMFAGPSGTGGGSFAPPAQRQITPGIGAAWSPRRSPVKSGPPGPLGNPFGGSSGGGSSPLSAGGADRQTINPFAGGTNTATGWAPPGSGRTGPRGEIDPEGRTLTTQMPTKRGEAGFDPSTGIDYTPGWGGGPSQFPGKIPYGNPNRPPPEGMVYNRAGYPTKPGPSGPLGDPFGGGGGGGGGFVGQGMQEHLTQGGTPEEYHQQQPYRSAGGGPQALSMAPGSTPEQMEQANKWWKEMSGEDGRYLPGGGGDDPIYFEGPGGSGIPGTGGYIPPQKGGRYGGPTPWLEGGQSFEGPGDPGDGSSYRPGGVNHPDYMGPPRTVGGPQQNPFENYMEPTWNEPGRNQQNPGHGGGLVAPQQGGGYPTKPGPSGPIGDPFGGNQRGQRAPEGNMLGDHAMSPEREQLLKNNPEEFYRQLGMGQQQPFFGGQNHGVTEEQMRNGMAPPPSMPPGATMNPGGGWTQQIPWGPNAGTVNGRPGYDIRQYIPGKGMSMS